MELGSRVKKGDPLVEVVSEDWAKRKNEFLDYFSRWRSAKDAVDRLMKTRDRGKPIAKQYAPPRRRRSIAG